MLSAFKKINATVRRLKNKKCDIFECLKFNVTQLPTGSYKSLAGCLNDERCYCLL
jgi:hypothetical protein